MLEAQVRWVSLPTNCAEADCVELISEDYSLAEHGSLLREDDRPQCIAFADRASLKEGLWCFYVVKELKKRNFLDHRSFFVPGMWGDLWGSFCTTDSSRSWRVSGCSREDPGRNLAFKCSVWPNIFSDHDFWDLSSSGCNPQDFTSFLICIRCSSCGIHRWSFGGSGLSTFQVSVSVDEAPPLGTTMVLNWAQRRYFLNWAGEGEWRGTNGYQAVGLPAKKGWVTTSPKTESLRYVIYICVYNY